MQKDHLATKKVPLHVLIIGGGLGGLCLAQGLKKSGISVAVYERDSSAQFRNQGYRISIKKEGSQALRDCLPENLFNLCVATAIKTATRLVFLDQQLHLKFAKPLPHPPIPDEEGFGVNRLTLREILLAGLEGMVHFGKTCERFDQVEGGQVRASFADGTAATGDLLVGADGTNSVHLTEMPGYFSWTLSLTEAWRDADGPTLHQHARSLVKEWHPALRRLIDEADIPATFPVPITSAWPVKPWHTPNVTLLGDAIHTMSPGRGEGANVALRDAQLLYHTLVDVATNGASLAQAKAQYEREMLRYGFEAVSDALNKPYLSSASQVQH